MSFKVQVEVNFRAGHRLIEPYEGKCNNLHGEGYTAIIEFISEELNGDAMVIDFGDIKNKIKTWIDENWDHAYLYNQKDEIGSYLKEKGLRTFEFTENPTAELMAIYLFNVIRTQINNKVTKVGIVESFRDSIAYYNR
jgi:6-pyruvoyltetrahydropterin/6-carboxytetrahydropterin synthase